MRFCHLPLLTIFLVLPACSNLGGAVGSAAQVYWNSRNPPSFVDTPLQPQFTYLEVRTENSSALLVLAQVDQPSHEPRAVETWVSGSGEVLRTQGGFVVGSAGVPNLPESSTTVWGDTQGQSGQPIRLDFNMPSAGLSQLPMVWRSSPVPAQLLRKPSALLKRAQQIPELNFKAWLATAKNVPPRQEGYARVFQLVATHPATGNLVYGQYCVGGLALGQCIEYLLRTAAQNL